jgi:hypothetical protein
MLPCPLPDLCLCAVKLCAALVTYHATCNTSDRSRSREQSLGPRQLANSSRVQSPAMLPPLQPLDWLHLPLTTTSGLRVRYIATK